MMAEIATYASDVTNMESVIFPHLKCLKLSRHSRMREPCFAERSAAKLRSAFRPKYKNAYAEPAGTPTPRPVEIQRYASVALDNSFPTRRGSMYLMGLHLGFGYCGRLTIRTATPWHDTPALSISLPTSYSDVRHLCAQFFSANLSIRGGENFRESQLLNVVRTYFEG